MLCCCSQLESVGADRRRDAPRGSSSFSTNFASTGRVLLRYQQPSPFHSCHGADGWWGGWGDGGRGGTQDQGVGCYEVGGMGMGGWVGDGGDLRWAGGSC
jgi:hypothetical protein